MNGTVRGASPGARAVRTGCRGRRLRRWWPRCCGPAIAIPGFVEKLSEALRLPLEARVIEHGADLENAGRLTVAAGLAVAERPA